MNEKADVAEMISERVAHKLKTIAEELVKEEIAEINAILARPDLLTATDVAALVKTKAEIKVMALKQAASIAEPTG